MGPQRRWGEANLPVEHFIADDQAGSGADGFCERVWRGSSGRGSHSGEMAGDLGEAWEHGEEYLVWGSCGCQPHDQ